MRKPSSFLRACSLLTGFLMVMALFAIPMTVQADAEYVCAIGETQYETLDAALAAIGEGESEIIRLLKDIDYFGTMMIKGKTVTFDLNGYELFVMNTDLDNGLVVDDGVVNMVGTGQFFAIGTGNPGHGVLAQNGGQATVTGAIGRSFGVKAIGAGSFVHVRGDVTLSENAFFGVEAESGGAVQVDGDIDASKGWYGATAYSNGSIVVKGNIETQYEGVHAYEGSSITVYGNVTVASSVAEGAIAEDSGSTVWVMGNITANSGNSTGAIAKNSGLVTVDGTISAPTYIQLGTENKTPADFVPGTGSDAHYKVYTDGTNTVRVLNNAPTAKAVVPAQTVIVGGSTAAFTATDIAEDADGDNLSITAIITSPDSAVVSASIDSGTITLTGVAAGSTSIVVTVSDVTDTVNITVPIIVTVAPGAPTIITASLPDGMIGTAYSQMLEATGDTPITWSLDTGSNLPDGLSLTTDGVISGTPVTAGTFTFTVKAENAAGNDTKELSIIISMAPIAPSITTASLPDGMAGTAYSQTLEATGDTPIIWSLDTGSNLPDGLSLTTDGVISGIPVTAGTFTFTVKAENAAGDDTKELSITISAESANTVPIARDPVPAQIVSSGDTAAFTAADIAEDADGDSLSIAAIVTSPDSSIATASLDSSTVILTGVAAGSTSIVVTVSDGTDTVDVAVPITVTVAPFITYTVSFDSRGGSSVASITGIAPGSVITAPASPSRTGYSFGGWYKETSCVNAWNFSVDTVTANITLYAKWTYNDGDDSSGGGSTGGGVSVSTPATPTNKAVVSGTSTAEISLPVIVNTKTGNAAADLGTLAKDIFTGKGMAVLTVPSIPDVNSYTMEIAADCLAGSQQEGVLSFSTDVGSITIPADMLGGMTGMEGKQAGITIVPFSLFTVYRQDKLDKWPVADGCLHFSG